MADKVDFVVSGSLHGNSEFAMHTTDCDKSESLDLCTFVDRYPVVLIDSLVTLTVISGPNFL